MIASTVRSDQGLLEIQVPLALRTSHPELSDTSFFVWEWTDGYWGKWDNPVVIPLRERLQHIWGFGYDYDDNSGNYLRQGPLIVLSVPIWFPLLAIHLCALAWYYQRIGIRTFLVALTAVAFALALLLLPATD